MTCTLRDRKILLGVCGGVAAYKTADLASRLTAAGATVRTILTANACKMVAPKTFEAVTGQPVFTTLWDISQPFETAHIRLADWTDVTVVAPATANLLAKLAAGLCDDLLSTTLCACWQKPLLLAPAMNARMWSNPTVQRNVQTIRSGGIQLIGPETGRLACGEEGAGRMAEPAAILGAIEAFFT